MKIPKPPLRGRWTSFGDVIKLCDVVYYLGKNKIPYRCNNLDTINLSNIIVYDLNIDFKSNKQFLAFKKRFG
jgi:hypothetical protein